MNTTTGSQQINVELGEKEAEGIYSNLALISHSPAEFVIDFTRMLPGIPKAKVYARIVMTPQHAKSFLNALKENIGKYEKQFEEIKIHGAQPNVDQSIGFKSADGNETGDKGK